MSREELYGIIESLASGQGFYTRLLNRLNEVGDDTECYSGIYIALKDNGLIL